MVDKKNNKHYLKVIIQYIYYNILIYILAVVNYLFFLFKHFLYYFYINNHT